ncbi:hypothetical protein MTR67_034145 [Solanum verrucosum]|uniref:Pyruvate carboxyltransferase domain-containing protein n=1 Tax=Solanum verrucosum TaxID=315347 RepID=A0AAF0ZK19_SOLVR|nr:hypothetical protein MTR67_034139 [Solanum verrucosum]WMV40760.1 hypothetical protein MTR67_034145 [Solanum verrucosum]
MYLCIHRLSCLLLSYLARLSPSLGYLSPYFKNTLVNGLDKFSDPNYVSIFDTTLRDGEQAPGASMTATQKMDIARHLVKLGVDVIEAGFPASSEVEFELVKCIAHEIGNSVDEEDYVPMICGLARSTKEDIDRAWESLKYAKTPMIHMFISTSDIHMILY